MGSSSKTNPKWYLAYFFLAAFDILTVSIGLYLNHTIMSLYTRSVEVNREWAGRLGQLAELRELAGAVNAPGNNVFDTLNVASESAKMSEKFRRFKEDLVSFRDGLHKDLSEPEAEPLLKNLSAIESAINEMTEEASLIFSYFTQDQPDEAGKHMATMDRKYAKVNAAFAQLNAAIRTIQQVRFDQQRERAVSLQNFEYLIATLIVLMVFGASVYGHRIYRQMGSAAREKEQFLQELQEKENRYRLLVDGVKDHANIMLNPNGFVASWNTGAERLYGYQSNDILGQPCSRLYPSTDREQQGRVERLLHEVEIAGIAEEEGWHLHIDGSRFWGEEVITALRHESGELQGFSKVTRDTTERKRAQEELQAANAMLLELDQMKQQFFTDISHELRTPITVIRGEAEVTLRDKTTSMVEYKTTLERIVILTNHLNKLVTDLFFLARSESGIIQMNTQDLYLHELLTEATSDAIHLAQKNGITINFDSQVFTMMIQADPQRLRQMFMIIFDNAVTYTKEGGSIEVCSEQNGKRATVTISDTGIGIPPMSLKHVFERLYRTPESRGMAPSGTGLGLSIAKWIIEAHQGTIAISSTQGTGTTVKILLPLLPPTRTYDANPPH